MGDDSLFQLEGTDLSDLLKPSWLKEDQNKPSYYFDKGQEQEGRKGGRRPFPKRKEASRAKKTSRDPQKKGKFPPHKKERFARSQQESEKLQGWEMTFIPVDRSIDEVAKHIKKEVKAFPLFDLARLILEKPERYQVKITKKKSSEPEAATTIFQCVEDGSLWLHQEEVIQHLLKHYRDRYYRTERVAIDPPKGVFKSVALCGMSKILLGPSNHHEYQSKVLRLHAERFSNMPLEVFKSRIQVTHDEELINKWKEEQSEREEFFPLKTAEGEEPQKLVTLQELEEHFKAQEASALIKEVSDEAILSARECFKFSSPTIQRLARQGVEQLKRFPLSLSHIIGEELPSRGIQIFKAHQKIVYASAVRPHYLDRQETPVSPQLVSLLDSLESHDANPREEQWKTLLEDYIPAKEMSDEEKELALAKDLSWLLHQGYVTNYAQHGFEVTQKPQKKSKEGSPQEEK